ncbi:MAG TPA: biotin/lipoyl-containing protein [Gemmatimonadaceae bacterium]|nr:biotin/lipoyl-containing protein [Gemmatimonadaceae bacterium]
MKYYVTVGDTQLEVERDGDRLTIDGTTMNARLERVGETNEHVLRIGDATHRVHARRGDARGRYDLSIDGYRLNVEALDERAKAVRDLARASARPAGPARLVAPMPGLVVRINVNEGDAVRAGQGLVVIEAMKMENELKAGSAGIVRRVLVSAGNAVEKGTLLLELEAADAGK